MNLKFNTLTPLEVSALSKLKILTPDDYEAVATYWLESGHEGEDISSLAYGRNKVTSQYIGDFNKALEQTGLSYSPNEQESLWLTIRYFLILIDANPEKYMIFLSYIISLDHDFGGKIKLFDRPDCRAYFKKHQKKYPKSTSSKYAGEEYGIENLYGLYYLYDDYGVWTEELEIERRKSVIDNTKEVIKRFYSKTSKLPDDLSEIKRMI